MSDEFDKEAEREKLREKFARDEEKREHTQRMSELLLKGATMTNQHCETCSDPIFRHDGREFCPTCNRRKNDDQDAEPTGDGPVSEGANETGDAPTGTAAPSDAASSDRARRSNADAGVTGTAPANGSEPAGDTANAAAPASDRQSPTSDRQSAAPDRQSPIPDRSSADAGRSAAAPDPSVGSDDVASIRASLTRTLGRFARAAEESDDPRRAREHLRAAREAAETLATLNR